MIDGQHGAGRGAPQPASNADLAGERDRFEAYKPNTQSATVIRFPRRNGVWLGGFTPREFAKVSPRLRASVARMAAQRRRPW